jgi:cathepsin L
MIFQKNTLWSAQLGAVAMVGILVMLSHSRLMVYLMLLLGVPNETTYPYMAANYNGIATPTTSGICSTNQKNALPTATPVYLHGNTSTQIKTLLVDSPVAVGIYADAGFQAYSSGTYGCSTATTEDQLDHAILIVGYNAQGDYIIKNSWSTSWGDQGFGIVNASAGRDCGITF